MHPPIQPDPQRAETPFFVRFLETQELAVKSDVKAGKPNHTLKYPSDGDEI